LSHSVEGQPWQSGAEGTGLSSGITSLDFASGQGIPSWTFKVEGRLLDIVSCCYNCIHRPLSMVSQANANSRIPARKFTSFLKGIIIEFDRDPNIYSDGNIAEVHLIRLHLRVSDSFS
jgi:SWI/SNF-related matrix-associated actin-dependent regulator of chromatin subfamily D